MSTLGYVLLNKTSKSIFLQSHAGMPQVTALGILLELVVSLHFYSAWHWSVLLLSLSKLHFIWNVLWAFLFVLIRRYFTSDALALYLSVLPVYILMSLALVCFASASKAPFTASRDVLQCDDNQRFWVLLQCTIIHGQCSWTLCPAWQ